MSIYLSVVIPAYNEEKNLRKGVLSLVWDYLRDQDYKWEVLVVDDGSSDETVSLVEKFQKKHKSFRVLREPHRGKGGTVIAGMLEAKGKIILFTDMDQATPIEEVAKILPKFEEGYDIVIGSRRGRKGAGIVRRVMAFGFAVLRTLILRLPFKDTQCGFKAFSNDATKPIFKRMKVFKEGQTAKGSAVNAGFDLEVLYIARKLGYKIAEVAVEWHDTGDRGSHGVNPIRDSWEGLRDLLKVRINAFAGRYKTSNG